MLFFHYVKELKYRFFYIVLGFLVYFSLFLFFSKEILFILVKPLLVLNNLNSFSYFIFTNMSDVLILYFKISFIFGTIFTFFLFLIQFWFFLVQGLYNYEKNFIAFVFLLFSCVFYIFLLILYFYLIPFIWHFFLTFEQTSSNGLFGIYYEARINDYIDFMLSIFIIFSNFLQLPFIMIFVIYFNLINISFFVKFRKYFIVFFFILGGIFSPPDIFSQLFISLLMLLFYEIILLVAIVIGKIRTTI